LKYRDNLENCIAHAKELMDDDNGNLKEMSIDEWLHRLNLLELKEKFEK